MTEAAVDRASVEGLEGLTIGGLAGEVEMRKSSVFSLFGSKEELQLATLEAAIEQFTDEVWGPVADERAGAGAPAGPLRQLARLPRARGPAGRLFPDDGDGRVRRQARPAPRRGRGRTMERWLDVLEREVATAIEAGELPADTEPADVAFQLNALAAAASYGFQLSRDREVFGRARRSMRRALGA